MSGDEPDQSWFEWISRKAIEIGAPSLLTLLLGWLQRTFETLPFGGLIYADYGGYGLALMVLAAVGTALCWFKSPRKVRGLVLLGAFAFLALCVIARIGFAMFEVDNHVAFATVFLIGLAALGALVSSGFCELVRVSLEKFWPDIAIWIRKKIHAKK